MLDKIFKRDHLSDIEEMKIKNRDEIRIDIPKFEDNIETKSIKINNDVFGVTISLDVDSFDTFLSILQNIHRHNEVKDVVANIKQIDFN